MNFFCRVWGPISLHLSFASPAGRALAKGLPEQLAEMRLIREPGAQGYFA
jgi:hypothetical protein